MGTFSSLEEIEVWQEAREFADQIYALTSESPFSEDFALRDQIRRAANSISLNIAEGYGLNSKKEFTRHLIIARGSCKEVKSALYLAVDQEYLQQERFEVLKDKTDQLSKRVSALMQYLKNN